MKTKKKYPRKPATEKGRKLQASLPRGYSVFVAKKHSVTPAHVREVAKQFNTESPILPDLIELAAEKANKKARLEEEFSKIKVA